MLLVLWNRLDVKSEWQRGSDSQLEKPSWRRTDTSEGRFRRQDDRYHHLEGRSRSIAYLHEIPFDADLGGWLVV